MTASGCSGDRALAPPAATWPEPHIPAVSTAPLDPGGAGAAALGTTRYATPAAAVHVDGARGDDGAPGTEQSPVRTIQAGVERAPAHGTVVVHGGTYHETVHIGRPVTVQSRNGDVVWLDGSEPMTQWTREPQGWSAHLPVLLDREIGPDDGVPYLSAEHPAAAEPEVLLRDGAQVPQRLPEQGIAPGTFIADRRRQRVTVADDPTGHDVRLSTLAQAIVVSAPDVTIRGIGVRRYGNSVSTQGAVYLARHGDLLEDVVVEDVATTGVSFYSDGPNSTGAAHRVTVSRAGLMGIGATRADGLRLTSVLVQGPNAEGFNTEPNSGGIKITKSRGVTIEGSRVVDGQGTTGIWLDESVVGFLIDRCSVENNGATGIEIELTSHGRITDTEIGSHDVGLLFYSAGDTVVERTTVRDDRVADLDVRQDHRRQDDPHAAGHDPRYAVGDPGNPWRARNIRVVDSVLGPGGPRSRVRVRAVSPGIDPAQIDVQLHRTRLLSDPGTDLAEWGGTPSTPGRRIIRVEDLPGSGNTTRGS